MNNPVTAKLIDALRKLDSNKPDNGSLDFVKDYYHRISGQDYSRQNARYFYDAAMEHLKLARKRKPDEALIDARNLSMANGEERTLISIVTDDQPFLINSLTLNLNRLNCRIERTLHPTFEVYRDKYHRIKSIHRYRSGELITKRAQVSYLESFIQFEVDPIGKAERAEICRQLHTVINNIKIVAADWKHMQSVVLSLAEMVERGHQGPSFAEYGALFRWMSEDHFAFIGYGEVTVSANNKVHIDADSLSGILRAAHEAGADVESILPPLAQSETSAVIFTKSSQRVYIYRASYLDCVLIDHNFGQTGGAKKNKPRRISCILGFLGGSTATMPIKDIPHLRSKAAFILSESSLRKGGYAYKELRDILETLPRGMILQIESRPLYGLCMTLLNQQQRRKTRVHIYKNRCSHFYSCLVYVPRDLFNSHLRVRIMEYLREQLQAEEVTFNVYFSESILTRIHYTAHCDPNRDIQVDPVRIEQHIQGLARDWNENLLESAQHAYGLDKGRKLLDRWQDAFPNSYQARFAIEQAMADITLVDSLEENQIIPRFSTNGEQPRQASFKLYSPNRPLPLSDVLPILENMGTRVLSEHPYHLKPTDNQEYWINDFKIVRKDNLAFDSSSATNFQNTFEHVWRGDAENDGFNQLTTLCGFDWRTISLLRAYFRYLKQIRLRYSENYIIDAIVRNPALTTAIAALFSSRFDPKRAKKKTTGQVGPIKDLIAKVNTLDEERILSALLDVLEATLRTNFYQHDNGSPKPYLSFKLNSKSIPRIPEPAPKYEIFVYSPSIEGVHLRGGDVARGGLRWSERPEDFRTEVLGLVKAQRVKNAVIVPVGSKGGFVAKQLPDGDREAIQAEVIRCYQKFISGMLDVTDNIIDGKIIPPRDVVRMDGDDPYLVVAADKGTATFSDTANALSIEYQFWLGDAFASGGSAGYDHKKMGITARGAWESVKRHFRERGKDIQTQEFTAVGVGDMAGDVFGNGMLLSPCTRLVAAFNHLHIFIDPTPDAKRSYQERKRLFDLPRSSWSDYHQSLLSSGGGIYERSAKSITLSPQAKKALSASRDNYTPDELINAILQSDVELLWNGGIGTYVKASHETHGDAQDRNNDSVRVDANQLRVKVIGEGGNLGMTQFARIEYNQGGGKCYTDAIDNSAGVDTSDHEVNIKILLNQAIQSGALRASARNALLAKMEQEVADLVLQNNYIQTQILSLETSYGADLMSQQIKSIQLLENKGLLNRSLEQLAEESELTVRRDTEQWFTSAELAVLLSYSKIDLYNDLLASKVPDDTYLQSTIEGYFPKILSKKFPKLIQSHRLKREIISTVITNDLVGMLGANFHLRVADLTGIGVDDIVKAYLVAKEILNLDGIQGIIQRLDNRISTQIQKQLLRATAVTVESMILWIVRHLDMSRNIDSLLSVFSAQKNKAIKSLGDVSASCHAVLNKPDFKTLCGAELTKAEIQTLTLIPAMSYICDMIHLAKELKQDVGDVALAYFSVGERFQLFWIRSAIDHLTATNQWNLRAQFSLSETLRSVHSALVSNIAKSKKGALDESKINDWLEVLQR